MEDKIPLYKLHIIIVDESNRNKLSSLTQFEGQRVFSKMGRYLRVVESPLGGLYIIFMVADFLEYDIETLLNGILGVGSFRNGSNRTYLLALQLHLDSDPSEVESHFKKLQQSVMDRKQTRVVVVWDENEYELIEGGKK